MLIIVALIASTVVHAADDATKAAAADVEPIDFEGAWAAARRSLRQGATVDDAAAAAERVLDGEVSFMPIASAPADGASFLYAQDWISESDAQLLQHEVIRSDGWRLPDGANPGLLELCDPLPPWAHALAQRLSPALDGQVPDRCAVHALEPGQSAPILQSADGPPPSEAAVLSLGSAATLLSPIVSGAAGEAKSMHLSTHSTSLAPRSVLLVARLPNGGAAPPCVQCGDARHLSITFWRARK